MKYQCLLLAVSESVYRYDGLVVVCRIHEESVGNAWSEYLAGRLKEGSDGPTPVLVHQSSLLMSIPCT